MRQGWTARRASELNAGRAALRQGATAREPIPARFSSCTTRAQRLAYLARLANKADERSITELALRIVDAGEELRFAARAALVLGVENARRARRETRQNRLKTSAPQVQTTTPTAPSA